MQEPLTLGRYTLFRELAAGGMATVYLGRASGAVGFGRTVAIKRLHPHLARDPELVSRFVDEARLVARVHHPNVVPTLDVVAQDGEIFLVLEYVKGESLGGLLRASVVNDKTIPVPVALSVISGALNGLHAAHEARDEKDEPLHIVHRDVSPQNVIVGADGIARVLDFGVAKAAGRLFGTTRDGQLKGKVPYMAVEQLSGSATRQTDVYAVGVVLWEMLTRRGLFRQENELQLLQAIMTEEIPPPSHWNPNVPPEVDRITMKALSRSLAQRYATAHEMAEDMDACTRVASPMKVAEWVHDVAGATLAARGRLVAEVESGAGTRTSSSGELPGELETLRIEQPSMVTVPSTTLKLPTSPPPARSRSWLAVLAVVFGSIGSAAFLLVRAKPEPRASVDAASVSHVVAVPMADADLPAPRDSAPPAAERADAGRPPVKSPSRKHVAGAAVRDAGKSVDPWVPATERKD